MFSILHCSDPHFGEGSDPDKVEATVGLIPDLEPNVIVVSGDLTRRARHGEFQAARLWIHELERTAPVYVLPGNRDLEWWRRPLVPVGRQAVYRRYARYFGPTYTPTMRFHDAVLAGVLTSYGLTWQTVTPRLRDAPTIGYLPAKEAARVAKVFKEAGPDQARILVMHHNPLRGEASEQMGVIRWKAAHRRIMESGAEIVLCGHDHQEKADAMGGVVVSCAGTMSAATDGARPATFHRITIERSGIHIEVYRWEANYRVFRRTDVHAFTRRRVPDVVRVPAGAV